MSRVNRKFSITSSGKSWAMSSSLKRDDSSSLRILSKVGVSAKAGMLYSSSLSCQQNMSPYKSDFFNFLKVTTAGLYLPRIESDLEYRSYQCLAPWFLPQRDTFSSRFVGVLVVLRHEFVFESLITVMSGAVVKLV